MYVIRMYGCMYMYIYLTKLVMAGSDVKIEAAPGSARIDTVSQCQQRYDKKTCRIEYGSAPCGCCEPRSQCEEGDPTACLHLKQHSCRYSTATPSIQVRMELGLHAFYALYSYRSTNTDALYQ